MVNEDWEKEFDKDFVYLLEERMLMEEEYRKWLTEESRRKSAKINVIFEYKTVNKDVEQYNILPF